MFGELHLPSLVNITYLNKLYKNYSSNNSLEFFSQGRVQKGESPECKHASMPETTKHKVLLCVVCFVSCCNLLWRYFTALNEKTANSDVRHWIFQGNPECKIASMLIFFTLSQSRSVLLCLSQGGTVFTLSGANLEQSATDI